MFGNDTEVEKLLSKYATPEIFICLSRQNSKKETALHLAVRYGNTNTIQALLGACPDEKKFEAISSKPVDETPLHLARDAKITSQLLDACPENKKFQYMTMRSTLYNWTPLQSAVENNLTEKAAVLFDACDTFTDNVKWIFLSMPYDNDITVLHKAAEKGYSDIIKQLIRICPNNKKLAFILLKDGASSFTYGYGVTAIFEAASNHQIKAAKELLAGIESAIFSVANQTVEVARNKAQKAMIALKREYYILLGYRSSNFLFLNLIAETIAKLFALVIYNENYVHSISEDDFALLKKQIVALLEKDNTVSVPLLIQDYFKVLTKTGQISDVDDYADFDTEKYFATPWGLHAELTSKELNKTAFKAETKDIERMKTNLLKAKQKGHFSDI